MISLRPYQLEAISSIRDSCRTHSAVLAVSPTGSGKTTIASELASRAVAKGSRVLWLAHRSELVDQAYDRLKDFGLNVGAVSASSSRAPNPFCPVQVASIQTLLARKLRPEAQVLIWDEAHHAPSDLWSGLAKDYAKSKLIGFTATPERSDGRGLGAVYQDLLVVASVKELVQLGHLVPCEIVRPQDKLRSGQIAQRPVDAYRQHAPNRRAIVFSPCVLAAEQHAQEFREAHIDAEVVHGDTPWGERQKLLERFRAGDLRVLVNVYVLTEGFDAPETDCVILARSCGTVGTYLQMVGRGLRPAPGKRECILIDLHGVSHMDSHGHPEDDREFNLDGKGIRRGCSDEVDDTPSCRVCGAPVEPGESCAECGTEAKKLEAPKVTGDALVKYAAKRREDDDKRALTLSKWIAAGQAAGYKSGWAPHKYKIVYGGWPSKEILAAARALLTERAA